MSTGNSDRHVIDSALLGRIELESVPDDGPAWDGLSDEEGPIPTFGPARTDERGRVVMSDEERAARRGAAIRALGAIGGITDETDTEAVWDEVSRSLGEGR